MTRQTFFLLAAVAVPCVFGIPIAASGAASAETETFDRIVLKDMTVIKASLVKDMGDSLAYFELNDTEFIKRMVGRDQVFKWIRAVPLQKDSPRTKAPPASDSVRKEPQNRLPEKNEPVAEMVKDSVKDSIPVVDYQSVVSRNKAPQGGGVRRDTVSPTPVKADTALATRSRDSGSIASAQPVPVKAADYDSTEAVPAGLSQVRLDPPTQEGVKIIPRSGMLAININPSLGSLGLGIRDWTSKRTGFAFKAAVLWGSESGFNLGIESMEAINLRGRIRWYGFYGIGYQWMTITTPGISMMGVNVPSTSMNLSFVNFILGLGMEWRGGINRNHGVSFEIGYQAGKADYTIKGYTTSIAGYSYTVPDSKGSYSMPIYFGGSYAYYF